MTIALSRPRAREGEVAIVLALTALVTVVSLMPLRSAAIAGLAVIGLTLAAWRHRAAAATSLGLLFATCLALGLAGVGPQQGVFALAFVIYAGVISRVPWLCHAGSWLKAGALDRTLMALGVCVAAVSAVALLAWRAWLQPDLADLVRTFVPSWPVWLLVPGAMLFALANAALEEAVYRGVVLDALDAALGPGVVALVLQALAFAALHFQGGFPRGVIGVGLAFVYGLALGGLRRTAGGLLAPWATHVLTDVVIVSVVLVLARG